MKLRGIVSVSVVAVLIAMPVTASQGEGKGCAQSGGKQHRMWSELGLSDEQKSKLKELHEEMQSVKKDHWTKMKELREQVREELAKDEPGRTVLSGYVAQQADLHKAMTDARIDHLLKVKDVLNKEQFAKLLDKHWVGGPACRAGGGGDPQGCPRASKCKGM